MFLNNCLKYLSFSLYKNFLRFAKNEKIDLKEEEQIEIISEFKDNKEVFSIIYNHYFEMIFKYLLKRTMSSETAFDLCADTFEKAFASFHNFKWQGHSIKVWLFRIAINSLKNYRREKQVSALENVPEGLSGFFIDAKEELKELDILLFGDEKLSSLSDAIESLNPKYKEIISLYYFSNMSQKEISETLKLSLSSVKSSMHRAIENLRKILIPKNNLI